MPHGLGPVWISAYEMQWSGIRSQLRTQVFVLFYYLKICWVLAKLS